MSGNVTAVPCPACDAGKGEWCRRHGSIQPGPLLACVARVRASRLVTCPVSRLTGDWHGFRQGSGVAILWDVMGDPRKTVHVCPGCGEHAQKPEGGE